MLFPYLSNPLKDLDLRMEKFVVSARKYRPVTFSTVVGQPSITNTLKNAIRNNHLAQAFLFTGPRGVGKTTTARILAKTINCQNISEEVEACNVCETCQAFNDGHSLNIYELDAASNNSVDDIRALVDQVRYAPQMGKYKVYIIDEVHMLSTNAFNAFLKTLEEPPSYAIFILATTERHKIIPTILSRCQIFDFNRISVDNIVKHLQHVAASEGVTADADGLHIIAQKADGALRDSLSIFDQLVSFAGNNLTYKDVIENLNILDYDYYFRITDDLLAGNIPNVLITFNEILNNGFDGHNFINGLATHFRDLLVCRDTVTLPLLEVSPTVKEKYKVQALACSGEWLLAQLELAGKADYQYRSAKNQRLHIELTLMKMCTGSTASSTEVGKKKSEQRVLTSTAAAITSGATATISPIVIPVAEEPTTVSSINNQIASEALSSPSQKPLLQETSKINATPSRPVLPTFKKTVSLSAKLNGGLDKKVEAKSEAEPQPDIANSFNQSSLEQYWNEYAIKLEKAGRMSLSSAMTKRKPIIETIDHLKFTVDSAAVEKDMNDEKLELLAFLRKSLLNYQINLSLIVSSENLASEVPYTPSEKFKKLAEINPAMNELKKQFDLEIEY